MTYNWGASKVDEIQYVVPLILFAGFLLSLLAAPALDDASLAAVALVFIGAAFHSSRNIKVAVIALSIPLAHHLGLAPERRTRPGPLAAGPGPGFVLAAALMIVVLGGEFSGRLKTWDSVPSGAVAFMKSRGLHGNILNDFDWGAYLAWHGTPQSRIFVDGRCELVYPDSLLREYLAFLFGWPGGEKLLDHYAPRLCACQTGNGGLSHCISRSTLEVDLSRSCRGAVCQAFFGGYQSYGRRYQRNRRAILLSIGFGGPPSREPGLHKMEQSETVDGSFHGRLKRLSLVWGIRPIVSVALWVITLIIFLASPVLQMNDSLYSMLTAESLIQNFSPDLNSYSIPDFEADLPFATVRGHHAYQLVRINGKLLYGFPHGSSVLSAPFVALMNLFGVSAATGDRKFNLRGEVVTQKILAAILSASLVTVLFWTAGLVLSLPSSAVIALGAGLGTQVWSTASRGMWSHTWEIALGSMVVYLLLAAEIRKTPLRAVQLATLLSWMFFVRPTAVVPVICVSTYILLRRPKEFAIFATAGALWLAAFIGYSIQIFGTYFPFYYTSYYPPPTVHFNPRLALYATLLSPSRGIFILSPITGWALFLVMKYRRFIRPRSLTIMALSTITGVWLVNLSQPGWWGGACYGPRYLTDAMPWFVLLAIMGVAAIPPALRTIRSFSDHFGWSNLFDNQHSDECHRCVLIRNDGMEFQGSVARYYAGLVAAPVSRQLARQAVKARRLSWVSILTQIDH